MTNLPLGKPGVCSLMDYAKMVKSQKDSTVSGTIRFEPKGKFKSTYMMLDVMEGKRALSTHFKNKGGNVPILVKGYIESIWGSSDGISQEFNCIVESVELYPEPKVYVLSYLVEVGSEQIIGVFSSKSSAEKHVRGLNPHDPNNYVIEEMKVEG